MGLMDQLPLPADPGRFIVTPHPVLLDGQRNLACDLRPGESLYAFLQRHVDGLDGQAWAVTIGGRQVPRHLWHHVYPKHGQVIELRGAVGKTALAIVALIALTYFTAGIGTAMVAAGYGAGAVAVVQAGVMMAGSLLINKVLGPKVGSAATSTAGTVYSLSSANNRARPYEPLGLLFGAIRITPDLASAPYTWFEGDDQYLGMTLTPGINVHRIDALYNGDTLLSSYEGVTVWHSGYSGMPEQTIPLYSNADTAQGGTLIDTSTDPKHTAGAWIERTSSADTIRLQVDIEFVLYDTTSKGKPKHNYEIFNLQYRPTGSSTWLTWGNFAVNNSTQKTRRVTYGRDVALGQYDVRVRVQGQNTDGKGASCNATWNTLTSIQQDTASYAGIPRTGIKIKATGQLNGALQEVRGKAYAKPLQLWDGSAWQTVTAAGAAGISNPGAQILYYARGIRDEDGTLIAGMGLDDDMIDIEALKAFMPYCTENDYRYDYWITDARSHSDVLDKIALNGMGEITWAGGKLSVVWAGANQPLSGVVNMATIKNGSFQVDYALANAADGIEYSYTDPDTLETKTLRVPAPGITTMLNPAQVAGEGITSEAHAARMARWHLAQSLYQFKSIGFDTDLEHLSYRRLSVLALQHDITQWGYGGRVRAAVNAGGTVTLTLDEPVPAPATGNAYIGLRIPGEAVYRVFAIQPFTGETTSITLADAWPSDAALPGDSDGNPAWDTIWIYDFKQTPGYRVRVTGIEPESDLKGASISVVPEGPEFWTYVLTGAYTPAPNQSLLPTRPVASNLRVTERNVIQGDTVYTELQVTFDISGRAVNTVVSCDVDGDGQLDEVAQTVTRSASFRIPGAGSYTLLVRPYDEDGNAGVPATIIYVTASADQPPVLVDSFAVDAIDGGLRRYTWGYNADTIQSPDFAGVEIRYTAGAATAPDWANMTPLGDSGFHTAAFESAAPAGGEWTFVCRSRNTSGTLSTGYLLQTVTLPDNLSEVIGGIDTAIEQHTAELVAAQAAVDQERADRMAAELLAQQGLAEQAAGLAGLSSALWSGDYDASTAYAVGDVVRYGGRLYYATAAGTGNLPTDTAHWKDIGNYSALANEVGAQAVQIDNTIDRVTAAEGDIDVLGGLVSAVETALPGKADASALTALQGQVTTQGNTITAQGTALTAVQAQISINPNMLANPNFQLGSQGWAYTDGWVLNPSPESWIGHGLVAGGISFYQDVPASGPATYTLSAEMRRGGSAGNVRIEMHALDKDNNSLATNTVLLTDLNAWIRKHTSIVAPGGTVKIRVRGIVEITDNSAWFRRFKLERGSVATLYSDDTVAGVQASVNQSMQAQVTSQGNNITSILAQYVLALNAAGKISGLKLMNSGSVSSAEFLADIFRVVSSGSAGLEWQDGYLRAYGSAFQFIIGTGFGINGDLALFFGPNVGAAAAAKNNAGVWFDTSGNSYFGGTLSAGTLHSSGRYNFYGIPVANSDVAQIVHANSSGRPKTIVLGITYGSKSTSQIYSSQGAATTARANWLASNAGSGSIAFSLRRNGVSLGQWTGSSTATASTPVWDDSPSPGWRYTYGQVFEISQTVTDNYATGGDLTYTAHAESTSGTFYAQSGIVSFNITE